MEDIYKVKNNIDKGKIVFKAAHPGNHKKEKKNFLEYAKKRE